MTQHVSICGAFLLALALAASPAQVEAKRQITYLANFTKHTGGHPLSAPILANDGNYYGVFPELARHDVGSVYRMTPSGDITPLHVFKGTDGANPQGVLVQGRDGALYGTTHSGGRTKRCGTIFRLTLTGTFTSLHFFNCRRGGGAYPSGGLVEASNGLLYGLSEGGGTHGDGTVYSMDPAGGAFSVVSSFIATRTGSQPKGELLQTPDGTLFGITSSGGAHRGGTLFSLATDGRLQREFAFSENDHPNSGLAYDSQNGKLFGTSEAGLIWSFENVLKSFSSIQFDQFRSTLIGGVTLDSVDRTLYGFCATPDGGCIYSIDIDTVHTRHLAGHLKGNAVGQPTVFGSDTIIGVTQLGGSGDDGTFFSISLAP